MKRSILILAILLLLPVLASAHPGRTASDGCHYCRTNCDKWGVPWGLRHCHRDKSENFALLKIKAKGESQISEDFEQGQEAFVEGNYQLALKKWLPLAEKGHTEAQLNLSHMYIYGFGVKQDFNKAHMWLTEAAKHGNVEAQTNLGTMYIRGSGVPKNFDQAYKWYSLAAKENHPAAIFGLASMYANGMGVRQNYKEAFNLAQRAANLDDLGGQILLGQLYEYGLGVDRNYVKALMWYEIVGSKINFPGPEYKAVGEDAIKASKNLIPKMKDEEVKKATQLMMEWKPKLPQ